MESPAEDNKNMDNYGDRKNEKYRILLEASETKEIYVVDEAENIIKYLEAIYKNINYLLADTSCDQECLNSLLWTLDKSLEATLSITRVASSSIHNLGRAIYFSKREKASVEKHKSSGYFSTLRYHESNSQGKAVKRSSIISFEECLRMFSDSNANESISHQSLSSMKVMLSRHMEGFEQNELLDDSLSTRNSALNISSFDAKKDRNTLNANKRNPSNKRFHPTQNFRAEKVASFHIMYVIHKLFQLCV